MSNNKHFDFLSDMICRLKNSINRNKKEFFVNKNKFILSIIEIVHREGYVANYEVIDDLIRIDLKYYKSASVISDVKRLSKISKRIFLKADKVRLYHSDTSMLLISTSKGLMTSRQAIDNKVGGELILKLS